MRILRTVASIGGVIVVAAGLFLFVRDLVRPHVRIDGVVTMTPEPPQYSIDDDVVRAIEAARRSPLVKRYLAGAVPHATVRWHFFSDRFTVREHSGIMPAPRDAPRSAWCAHEYEIVPEAERTEYDDDPPPFVEVDARTGRFREQPGSGSPTPRVRATPCLDGAPPRAASVAARRK